MINARKKSLGIGPMVQLVGVIFFFLVVPFGMIFGILRRLFGSTHRKRDQVF